MVKETSALNIIMDDTEMRHLMEKCGEMGYLHCCYELLRIQPVPLSHPIITVLKVMAMFVIKYLCF